MQDGVLVTGGAGYIGSHVVKQLGKAGYENIIVLDNLSKGFADAVTYGELIVGDTGDKTLVLDLLKKHNIKSVLHFAAFTIVPESVEDPLKYYGNNTCSTRSLLECCKEAGVKHFIFSSTAAVYGIPNEIPVTEDAPNQPINPYGTSKLMTEWMLKDLGAASDLRYTILRYFNVAGCDPEGEIGQSTPQATLLTKVAVEAAVGVRPHVAVFGTDYDTKDGTGVRDYIHVVDLADAHIKALNYLENGGKSVTLNCGYGHGYSVREVIAAVEKAHGQALNVIEEPRRAGDPPALVANSSQLKALFNWQPQYDDIDSIVTSALKWEKTLQSRKSN